MRCLIWDDFCDLAELFIELNKALQRTRISLHHACRLSLSDFTSIEANGFLPLSATRRVQLIVDRIKKYAWANNLSVSEATLRETVNKFKDRDHGRVFFSLSRNFHLKDCPEYLQFGSEFEAVVVVHVLGRHHRRLLQLDSKPAFVTCEFDTRHLIDEDDEEDVHYRLSRGNYPELANFLLNPWLLWKVGRERDIRHLNADWTQSFAQPFPDHTLRIEWVNPRDISRPSA